MKRKFYILIILILCTSFNHTFSQNRSPEFIRDSSAIRKELNKVRSYIHKTKLDKALPIIDSLFLVTEEKKMPNLWVMCAMNKYQVQRRQFKYTFNELAENFEMIIEREQESPFMTEGIKAYFYHSYGNLYQNFGKYEDALEHFLRVLEINTKRGKYITPSHKPIGVLYLRMNMFEKALAYFQKTLTLFKKEEKEGLITKKRLLQESITLNKNIAEVYLKLQCPEEAKPYLDTSLDLYQKGVLDKLFKIPVLTSIYHYYFIYYKQTKQYDQAKKMVDTIADITKEAVIYRPSKTLQTLNDYASISVLQKDIKQATSYYEQVVQFMDSLDFPKEHVHMLAPPTSFYLQNRDYEKASYVLDRILPQEVIENKKTTQFLNSEIKHYVQLLACKTALLYETYKTNGDTSTLKNALKWSEYSYDFIDKASRITGKGINSVFDLEYLNSYAIQIALDLYNRSQKPEYFAKAIAFMEFNKAYNLNLHLVKNRAKLDFRIPREIQKKEQTLIENIELAQNYLTKNKINDSISNSIYNNFQQLDSLSVYYQKNHPEYANLQLSMPSIQIEEIRKKLSNNEETFISYYYDKSNLFICIISPEGYFYNQISIEGKLEQEILGFINSLKNRNIDNYKEQSKGLAKILYDPIASIIKTKKIIISPYDRINFIPFEILLHNDSFLLMDKSISYNFSIQQLLHSKTRKAKNDVLVFAPVFEIKNKTRESGIKRDKISPLLFSREEVDEISESYNSEVYMEEKATRNNFLTHANNARIIHLATHVNMDTDNPLYTQIIFAKDQQDVNNRLFLYEIFNLDLSSEMVVLSACETGTGSIKKGDGVQSLARSFAYAGAQSTVMSLWQVDDASTSELMKYFYQHLKSGEDKDLALRNAKLDYLENSPDVLLKHPYYWAGFVISGETTAITTNNYLYLWIFLISILLLSVFVFKKKLIK
ncbi:CHAT domain-containing tetratricopeptide repeat protein [uncultured Aquimarina sp.]|uniref:CHAT domain-containing protein n=1 Tax=uncultured Aquimarina sp. TaxID=575652 RepID=UPI00260E3639|nr:CHAT domain-containing tetratricopeptide repeat protein [uncultured Aquimarina sp.]